MSKLTTAVDWPPVFVYDVVPNKGRSHASVSRLHHTVATKRCDRVWSRRSVPKTICALRSVESFSFTICVDCRLYDRLYTPVNQYYPSTVAFNLY
jgi:hypothetical protein